jgi:type III secretion system chaperone SycN
MSFLASTVAEFGRSLGMDDLRLQPHGGVVLAIDRIGTLAFEAAGPAQDAVIISLARPLARPAAVNWPRLLAATHYRAGQPLRLQLGTVRDQLVFAVVLPQEEFTLPKVHEAIQALDRQHQATEAGL